MSRDGMQQPAGSCITEVRQWRGGAREEGAARERRRRGRRDVSANTETPLHTGVARALFCSALRPPATACRFSFGILFLLRCSVSIRARRQEGGEEEKEKRSRVENVMVNCLRRCPLQDLKSTSLLRAGQLWLQRGLCVRSHSGLGPTLEVKERGASSSPFSLHSVSLHSSLSLSLSLLSHLSVPHVSIASSCVCGNHHALAAHAAQCIDSL